MVKNLKEKTPSNPGEWKFLNDVDENNYEEEQEFEEVEAEELEDQEFQDEFTGEDTRPVSLEEFVARERNLDKVNPFLEQHLENVERNQETQNQNQQNQRQNEERLLREEIDYAPRNPDYLGSYQSQQGQTSRDPDAFTGVARADANQNINTQREMNMKAWRDPSQTGTNNNQQNDDYYKIDVQKAEEDRRLPFQRKKDKFGF